MSGSTDDIVAEAYRMLGVRPLTEQEMRRGLARRGHGEGEIEPVVETLRRRGYLGDAELAMQYVVARATRLGHGPLRLQRDLEQRGIDASVAQRAWQQAVEQGDVDPETLLGRAVERRLGGSALQGRGDYRRVYNALIRAGFDPHDVRAALAPHRAFEDGEDDFDA